MKKKIIIAVVVLAVLIIGIIALTRADISMSNPWLDGQTETAILGDLVIPVTATGNVEPAKLIQIKSKASGEVLKIHVVEGQMVREGEILVEMDPVDEKRNVESRQADLDRAASALEKARITLTNYERDLPLQTKLAQARYEDALARLGEAEFRWNKMKGYMESDIAGEVEVVTTKTSYMAAQAAKELAEVEVQRCKNNEAILLDSARQDVKQAEAANRAAQKALDEASLRLEETTVRAPSDGMVYSLMVRDGEMIQSGTMSLTGGTPLMFLADTRAMFVMALIDEADIGAIRQIAPSYARPGETQKLDEQQYRAYAAQAVHGTGAAGGPTTGADEGSAAVDSKAAGFEAGRSEQPGSEAAGSEMTGFGVGASEGNGSGADAASKKSDEVQRRRIGLPGEVTVEAYRAEKYEGVIERILPEPQRVNNAVAFRVKVRLVGEGLEKLMRLQADLSFTTDRRDDVVLIKNEGLHSEGRKCYVYVPVTGKPREEEKRPVEIGMTDGTYTEILSGIREGDSVFTKRPQKTQKEKEATG